MNKIVNMEQENKDLLLQEKLRLAKEALDSDSYDKETIEYIFPELKESEDERIRKEIIKFIKVSKPEWKNYSDYSSWIAWLKKQGEQKEINYDEELKKCKSNPLYFFDKYVKAKFKEQKTTDKVMTLELFGNIYEEVEDNSSEFACSSCALFKICEVTKPNLPCVRVNGSLNRHFILVNTKLNTEEKKMPMPKSKFIEIMDKTYNEQAPVLSDEEKAKLVQFIEGVMLKM